MALDLKKQQEIFNRVVEMVKAKKLDKEKVTKDEVFQPAIKENRNIVKEMCEFYMKDGSDIIGIENLKKLYKLAKEGKSCLIAAEHKSNLDVPNLYTLFENKYPENKELFESIVFIAGKKLNEETPVVKIFAEMFNRLVLVPKTTVAESEEDMKEIFAINRSAQKWLKDNKNNGYIFLIFPTGTRTRDWMPETAKGIRESYNYLKNFDYFCTLAIEGNTMPASPTATNMLEDPCVEDKIVYKFGKVMPTNDFITNVMKEISKNVSEIGKNVSDVKQLVVDKLMQLIYSLHKNPALNS